MFRLRGMDPVTFAKAFASGRRSVPSPSQVFVCVATHRNEYGGHISQLTPCPGMSSLFCFDEETSND